VQESGAARLVGVRHEAAQGLVGGRADEPVKRSGPGDVMGFEGVGEASENAWLRVRERAVEIEYCRAARRHVIPVSLTAQRQWSDSIRIPRTGTVLPVHRYAATASPSV